MKELSQNSLNLLQQRYLLSTPAGDCESPKEMFERVARAIAQAEIAFSGSNGIQRWYKRFYELMASLDFLPNSPTLMNAGTGNGQLSACFVLPVEDNLDAIFTTLKDMAVIQKSGGGTGFNFSQLRPKGDRVSNYSGTAAGPVSFLKIFNEATENIKQGGKRRGANMAILNVDHPDIEEFIKVKSTEGFLNNFNLSVGITDTFMKAVQADALWNLYNPRAHEVESVLPAGDIWNLIIDNAWKSGDPGLVFLDRIEAKNPTPNIGRLKATNPCGEMPLLDYESCNLGSVNLANMVRIDENKAFVDWEKLENTINIAIRFLDNVIDVNHYLIPKIKKITSDNRKIGLGVMGWADLLVKLKVPYASAEAIKLADQLMEFINAKSFDASANLAKERGSFPNWKNSVYYADHPVRNATRTSIAPTGSISVIAGVSSSIEPLFALAYKRENILDNATFTEINSLFVAFLKEQNIYSDELMQKVVVSGSAKNIDEISVEDRVIFKTALEINFDYHLQHQMAFQKHTDNAVSKTINLPNCASKEEISELYMKAWQSGVKGITIYRYASKNKQVLSLNDGKTCGVCTI